VTPLVPIPTDLAPGDVGSASFDWTGFELRRIRSTQDPLFRVGYDALWRQFGRLNEMEQESVLDERFGWDPARPAEGYALLYEMILVRRDERVAGVRDHVAIAHRSSAGGAGGGSRATVFLSHNLVVPEFRRTGLAGWLRALPVQAARACLSAAGMPMDAPITLVGEMDPIQRASTDAGGESEVLVRLRAYEKAGFLKLDPAQVAYEQPDFRDPAKIDASGGPCPIPMSLLVRRVGLERESVVSGREVRELVEALYHMYGRAFRRRDMAPLYEQLGSYPADDAEVRLVRPTV
jgi:hypothetical protein